MTKTELQRRTKEFGLRTLRLLDALPAKPSAWVIARQLGRAATAVGANYRAACKARSRAEFVAKIGIVEEEADECAYWLELIMEASLLKVDRVKPLHTEATELTAIMAASRITAARARRSSA